jgi:hypothetical protein
VVAQAYFRALEGENARGRYETAPIFTYCGGHAAKFDMSVPCRPSCGKVMIGTT